MARVTLEQRRTTITSLWNSGIHNAKTLHQITSIPLSTIYDYLKKLKNGISLDPLPRSGRPRKLTPRKRRHLGQLVSNNKYATCSELANTLKNHHPNLDINRRTVLNELYNLKYHYTYFPLINKHITRASQPDLTDRMT
ncbi:hypothetical protein RhiirA5_400209 [Rhizophagus irregularis]|uniref:Transposase Tc1-like domain-containing protein n=1 Tax=Rhizophagus irregularis TaxID=588596 RepID=A0A2N0PIT0_9GLOM|nr:hypothetical protein RhiirA5_400209 [Rhizophagus irregularis]